VRLVFGLMRLAERIDGLIVGLARPIYLHVHMVFLAGKLPNIRPYTMYLYGSGQS
jgi:hypothetical protein